MNPRIATIALCLIAQPLALGAAEPPLYTTWAGGMEPDKCATAWLLTRRVSPGARFKFFPRGEKIAEGTTFEVPFAKLTRAGNLSGFECALAAHKLDEPALLEMGRIMHDIEINTWQPKATAEAAGLTAVIRGLARTSKDDHEVLERSFIVLDALHAELAAKYK